MKNLRREVDDTLRTEYKRTDFGPMVRGKHADSQVEFAELVRLLLVCIGEDEGVNFIHYSQDNTLAGHKHGDWTYEIDNGNQITLRYWLNGFRSIEETISNPSHVTTPQTRAELQNLILEHVQILKERVNTQ